MHMINAYRMIEDSTMKKIFAVAAMAVSIMLSGCANIDGHHDVNCKGVYLTNMGVANDTRYDIVTVNKIRFDRFGRPQIKPNNTMTLKFFGGFKDANLLSDYKCDGEDYGFVAATNS